MLKEYRYVNCFSVGNKLRRLGWNLVCTIAFRPTPRWALNGWRSALLRAFGAKVGEGCRIDPNVRIWAPWNLTMGAYSALAEDVDCYNVDQIKIGSKVAISQRTFLCTASHDISSLLRPLVHAPIEIGDHVWVAAEAMLHPGVRLGEGSVIAARTVLRDDTKPWSIWAGNPARQVGKRTLSDHNLPFVTQLTDRN